MATEKVTLRERSIFPLPRVTLREVQVFDVAAIADVASPAHARIARFLPNARPASEASAQADGALKAAAGLTARVRSKVAEVVVAEMERERALGKGVGIGSVGLQAQVAAGMIGAMAQVKRQLPSQGAAFSITGRQAVEGATELASSLARRSYSAAGSALVAARSRIAPLAKFAQSKIRAAGAADTGILFRAGKPLAMVAAGAVVTMALMGGADAQSQTRSRMQPTQSQVDASWLSASGISAILPDMPTIETNPSPRSPAAVRPVSPAPALTAPVAPSRPGVILKASAGFKEMAAMVAVTNLEDLEEGNLLILRLEEQGQACMQTWRPGKSCRMESAGISMDYATGNYTATLAPMRGISNSHRLVVVENAQGLKVQDSDALVDAKVFMESRIVEMARRTGEIPAEEEEDEVTPTPR